MPFTTGDTIMATTEIACIKLVFAMAATVPMEAGTKTTTVGEIIVITEVDGGLDIVTVASPFLAF